MTKYHLDDLGWCQFEQLGQSLLKDKLGHSVEAWGGSGDFGRDAYSKGPLRYPADDNNDGPFIFQMKFVSGANGAGAKPLPLLLKAIRAELKRIGKRKTKGEWQSPRFYTLLTNVPLSGSARKQIEELLAKQLRGCSILVQGGADIDSMLDASDTVRLSFPEILGLRDIFSLLEQTVNKDILTRSEAAVRIGTEMAKVFVATGAYARALEILRRRRLVVLTGPPEMGKTTIARIIALAQLADGWEAVECRGPGDVIRAHVKDRPQIFLASSSGTWVGLVLGREERSRRQTRSRRSSSVACRHRRTHSQQVDLATFEAAAAASNVRPSSSTSATMRRLPFGVSGALRCCIPGPP